MFWLTEGANRMFFRPTTLPSASVAHVTGVVVNEPIPETLLGAFRVNEMVRLGCAPPVAVTSFPVSVVAKDRAGINRKASSFLSIVSPKENIVIVQGRT